MRILLTNDDGVGAPGIDALRQAAGQFGEVVVSAPDSSFSGCGHQVTTDRPIRVVEVSPRRYAVTGTPADCTRLGLRAMDLEVDLVLAGINHGGNMGADVYISGTVAAAREAVLLGVPAIGFSHYIKREFELDWEKATSWTVAVLSSILDGDKIRNNGRAVLWNVNFPHLPPDAAPPQHIETPLDGGPLGVEFETERGPSETLYTYRADYHARPRLKGSDVDVCMSGDIAITALDY